MASTSISRGGIGACVLCGHKFHGLECASSVKDPAHHVYRGCGCPGPFPRNPPADDWSLITIGEPPC